MESSTDRYVKELFLNVRANHPVTVVYTDDPNETIALTRDAIPNLRKTTDKIFYWSTRQGWSDVTDKSKTFAECLGTVDNKLVVPERLKKTPLAYAFGSPEELKCKSPVFIMSLLSMRFKKDVIEVLQELRDFDYMVRNQQNGTYRLIIVANKSFEITDDYENIFGVVNHTLPTKEELLVTYRTSFLEEYCDVALQNAFVNTDEYNVIRSQFVDLEQYCVNTLSGLTERQVKIILFKGVSKTVQKNDQGNVIGIDMEAFKTFLYETKFAEIKKSGTINLLKPIPMEDVGGLQDLKSWLLQRTKAFEGYRLNVKGIKKPKGMILIGPSGTGKTYVAEATAGVLQFPCIQLNLSSIFNKFVGESESNMKGVMEQIEACAPAVVFIDEIDKVFAGENRGSGGDSGVTSRVLGKLLSWIQDTKSELFFVVTANRANNIPAELTRKGRFDEIWCVTFPTADERKDIINIHLAKRGYSLTDISSTVSKTEEFSSAELEHIVQEGVLQAYLQDEELSEKHVLDQVKLVNPIAISFKDDIDHMRSWAEKHARWASPKVTYQVEETKEI